MSTIAITGHRPSKIGDYDYKNPIWNAIDTMIVFNMRRFQCEKGITGMALGVDTRFALICIMRKIPFIAAIPCLNQEMKWPLKAMHQYREILSNPLCTVHYVSDKPYNAHCMNDRNIWMVDQLGSQDYLLGVWDGSAGGTKNCIDYAITKGIEPIIINPKSL